MQTFITHKSFYLTAKSLDNKRLCKQRVEAFQILKCLDWYRTKEGKAPAYRRHPAVLQWVGHETLLKSYLNAMINEWVSRGFKNTMAIETVSDSASLPWWMVSKEHYDSFIKTHRQRLMQKDLNYYAEETSLAWKFEPESKIFYSLSADYYWPVRIDKKNNRIARWNPDGSVIDYIIL